jgi:hypothetical protein
VRRLAVAAVVAAAWLPGCGVSGLSFVQDERVTITAPEDRSEIDLPFTVRWDARDFDGTFGVFVDRAPVPPGHTLEWLGRDDPLCEGRPGCIDEDWLALHDVYRTAATELTIERLPDSTRDQRRDRHEVTIVLLDGDGERVGESAFTVEFEVRRDA